MSYITSYQPQDVTFSHGDGVWLWDTEGNQYLDSLSGIAVTSLGHNHPAVTKTIQEQAQKLLHTSNVYKIEKQLALAEKILTLTKMEQVFFSNSGAEANEAAIKVARLYGHSKGIDTPTIIVMEQAFHGRTMATLTASAGRKGQAGFEPLVPGFVRAPFNDIEAIKTIGENRNDIVAILVEPIQGEGGVMPAEPGYLTSLRKVCDENQWLLMLDEIQTGVGRTGELYCFMHEAISPDVLTSAKALANGVPIGACMMKGPACNLLMPGKHGSTFGGNPLATATALSVLEEIEAKDLCKEVSEKSAELMNLLISRLVSIPQVKSIRGKGFMIGVELDRPCRELMKVGLKHRLLFNVTAEKVIRLLPPLIIAQKEMELLVDRLEACIQEFYSE